MVTPLISVSDIKGEFNFSSSYSGLDSKLSSLIDKSTELLEKYTRRNFEKTERTEQFDVYRNIYNRPDLYGNSESGFFTSFKYTDFYLRAIPVDSEADFTVWYDPYLLFETASQVSSTYYDIDYTKGVLTMKYGFPTAYPKALKVTYTGGYSTTDGVLNADELLKEACIFQTLFLYNKRRMQNIGVKLDRANESDTGIEYSRKGIIPPEVMELVAPYRKPVVRG